MWRYERLLRVVQCSAANRCGSSTNCRIRYRNANVSVSGRPTSAYIKKLWISHNSPIYIVRLSVYKHFNVILLIVHFNYKQFLSIQFANCLEFSVKCHVQNWRKQLLSGRTVRPKRINMHCSVRNWRKVGPTTNKELNRSILFFRWPKTVRNNNNFMNILFTFRSNSGGSLHDRIRIHAGPNIRQNTWEYPEYTLQTGTTHSIPDCWGNAEFVDWKCENIRAI